MSAAITKRQAFLEGECRAYLPKEVTVEAVSGEPLAVRLLVDDPAAEPYIGLPRPQTEVARVLMDDESVLLQYGAETHVWPEVRLAIMALKLCVARDSAQARKALALAQNRASEKEGIAKAMGVKS